ncbi:MAG: GYD domain-containing protein [Methanomassiliicoccales archaeon]
MRFISLIKFKGKPTKEKIAQNIKCIEKATTKYGVKIVSIDWTLGRYDSVVIMEAPDEKTALQMSLRRSDCMATETLVAIPAKEARKLIK